MKALEYIATLGILVIAAVLVHNALRKPEPEVVTVTEYKPGKPDTVLVRDTLHTSATIPPKVESGKITVDTLIVHDEYTSVRVWSRDVALEGIKVDIKSIVREVHITRVDTLFVYQTKIVKQKPRWHERREFGFVLGVAATIMTVKAIKDW
jgi:hypothetical protein